MNRFRQKGFTLIESLMALGLVSAIMLPASLWLYRSKVSQAAWERFNATQVLEMRMNRAFLLHPSKDFFEEIQEPVYMRVDIRVRRDGKEIKLLGTVKNRREKILSSLEACRFTSGTGSP